MLLSDLRIVFVFYCGALSVLKQQTRHFLFGHFRKIHYLCTRKMKIENFYGINQELQGSDA